MHFFIPLCGLLTFTVDISAQCILDMPQHFCMNSHSAFVNHKSVEEAKLWAGVIVLSATV